MTDLTKPIVYSASAISGGHQAANDADIDGTMWASIFGVGDGIVDASTATAASLTLVTDTATIQAFSIRVDGFRLDVATQSFTLASVLTPTVYSIGVLTTPANDSLTDVGGRLSLWYGKKASIPSGSGISFLTLWEVTRAPSTPMSGSTAKADYRLYATETSLLPGVASVSTLPNWMIGRRAILADGTRYVRVPSGTASADWVPSDMQPAAIYQVTGTQNVSGETDTAVVLNPSPSSTGLNGAWAKGSSLTVRVPLNGWYTIHSSIFTSVAPGSLSAGGPAFIQVRQDLPGNTGPYARSAFSLASASAFMQRPFYAGDLIKVEMRSHVALKITSGWLSIARTSGF